MGDKNLSSNDICAIIKACGESKVAILQFGDLCLWMDSNVVHAHLNPAPQTIHSPIPEAEISEIQNKQAQSAFIQAELALRADDAAELMITDPKRFEELIVNGDFEEQHEPDGHDDA